MAATKGTFDKLLQKQIAESFSNGNFELIYPYLSVSVQWTVVGENQFDGKKAVLAHCEQVAGYFKSVTTNFKTIHVIADNNKVAVIEDKP